MVDRLLAKLRRNLRWQLALFTVVCALSARGEEPKPLLLRDPSISATQIAFSYAGSIWTADHDGRHLRQLTKGGHESKPVFSPDGSQIAFTADFDGWHGVYVIPAAGGEPRRITSHPADMNAVAWTTDGRSVVFASRRLSFNLAPDENSKLFTIPSVGGAAVAMPVARAAYGSFSADGSRIAYVPSVMWGYGMDAWKHYRGGQTKPIWIARLSDASIEARIPRDNSNDFNPMWVRDRVYFLSDRDGPVTLFAYDLSTKQVRRLIDNHSYDIKSAAAGAGLIVYEQFGSLHIFDPRSGHDRALDIEPQADFPEVKPHTVKVDESRIRFADLSPDGDHVVFGFRGEILDLSAKDGKAHNLTETTDVSEIDPSWSPDSRSVAYFSDASGVYALHVKGIQDPTLLEQITLSDPPTFYYSPSWSPDSRKIAYTDKRLAYWYVDLDTKRPVQIDKDIYVSSGQNQKLTWSPDSRWIAYVKHLPSRMHALFVYSLEQKKSFQLTDGESDVLSPVFDRSGRYLLFLASTDSAFSSGWWDMTSTRWTPSYWVYAIALRRGEPSAWLNSSIPTSKEDAPQPGAAGPEVEIDAEDIQLRIAASPIPRGIYTELIMGASNRIYLVEARNNPQDWLSSIYERPRNLLQFDSQQGKLHPILAEFDRVRVSSDGSHALYRQKEHWFVADLTSSTPGESQGRELNLDGVAIFVDPRREWRHMYAQAWRDEQQFFYDPGLHGVNVEEHRQRYEPFLDNLATREDLNYLFADMLGNMTVGHMYITGGDIPRIARKNIGLLGADFTVLDGHYCFERIYHGVPWDPSTRAPFDNLSDPVKTGECLIAVNGRQVRATDDIYCYFGDTANKKTELTIAADPTGQQSRTVEVLPVEDEAPLRNYAWVEKNKALVDKMTGSQVAYIYLPNTSTEGYQQFVQHYFAQIGQRAVIIDERYNHGGDISDFMVDALRRPLLGYWHTREGRDLTEPAESIFGPKVMLVNEMSGSGGDALAWMFHEAGVGPLIGKRTWGGLVGTYTDPDDLLDGGFIHNPNFAFYNTRGAWAIENHGVAPDIEVDDSSSAPWDGEDPQLETACAVVLELLRKNGPPPSPAHPPYPDYSRQLHLQERNGNR